MIDRGFVAGVRSIAVVLLIALAACGTPRTITLDDRDDAIEFRKSLEDYARSTGDLLRDMRHGKAVSDFSMGMLTYDILTTVSAVDSGLYGYFTADGQDIEDYLKTRFQAKPEEELAALDKLGGQGSPTLRAVARHTLDALAHLPDSHDLPAAQKADRALLENALQQAKAALDKAALEVRIP